MKIIEHDIKILKHLPDSIRGEYEKLLTDDKPLPRLLNPRTMNPYKRGEYNKDKTKVFYAYRKTRLFSVPTFITKEKLEKIELIENSKLL